MLTEIRKMFNTVSTALSLLDQGGNEGYECKCSDEKTCDNCEAIISARDYIKQLEDSESIGTVNVIELINDKVVGLHAFLEDEKGNAAATELFKSICRENMGEFDDDRLNEVLDSLGQALDDGEFECGNWKAMLVHSS